MLDQIDSLELPEGVIPEEFEHHLEWTEKSASARTWLMWLVPSMFGNIFLSIHLMSLLMSLLMDVNSFEGNLTAYILGAGASGAFALCAAVFVAGYASDIKNASRYAKWLGKATPYIQPIIDQVDRYENQVELLQRFFRVKDARNSVLGLLNSPEFEALAQQKIDKLILERADILQKLRIAGALVNVHDDSFDGLSELFFDNDIDDQVTAETIAHVSAGALPVVTEVEVKKSIEKPAQEEQIPGVISIAAERSRHRKEA